MKNIEYSNFKSHLAAILDKVSNSRMPVLVTRPSGKSVVVMSVEDFKSYEETAYLMSSLKNVERLNRSIHQLESKKCRHY